MMDDLTAGDVARHTGSSVSALRYYDELGLITTTRRVGGKRRFDAATVGRVNLIRRAQEFGFTLSEIGILLDDTDREWPTMVRAKRSELVAQRQRLDALIAMLDETQDCGCAVVASCPALVESLAD